MGEKKAVPNYKRHRFPPAIIGHAVWLSFRFALSYRDVEELLAERGVIVTYATIRQWCRKFGQAYANELRRRRPRPGDTWYLDEVFIGISGVQHYPWRAVDQEGNVLDILAQARRDKAAAKQVFRRLLKELTHVPRVLVTDKLPSYGAAKREVMPSVEHRQHRRRNNRAEIAHQPTRERERRPRRHRLTASAYRRQRAEAFATWREVTGAAAAARSNDGPRPSTPTGHRLVTSLAQVDNAFSATFCRGRRGRDRGRRVLGGCGPLVGDGSTEPVG